MTPEKVMIKVYDLFDELPLDSRSELVRDLSLKLIQQLEERKQQTELLIKEFKGQ